MNRFRGIIALDIDGTITIEKHTLEEVVGNYLNFLIAEGWCLAFVTGRTFSFAYSLLKDLEGAFFLSVQNGAALYEMKSERQLSKYYIDSQYIPLLESIFLQETEGLLIETGKEHHDACFYKAHDFTEDALEYIKFRISISPESWFPVETFDHIKDFFAVAKFFATKEKANLLASKITAQTDLKVTVIRDPFRQGFYIGHINNKNATKAQSLTGLTHEYPLIIAAGDDFNDEEMLKEAQIKIVMENAPYSLLSIADIVAKAAKEQGIIQAIKDAIKKWKLQ